MTPNHIWRRALDSKAPELCWQIDRARLIARQLGDGEGSDQYLEATVEQEWMEHVFASVSVNLSGQPNIPERLALTDP
jgi:hypothetical protein